MKFNKQEQCPWLQGGVQIQKMTADSSNLRRFLHVHITQTF